MKWQPNNTDIYKEELDDKIADICLQERLQDMSVSLNEKLTALESVVSETAKLCRHVDEELKSPSASRDPLIQQFIDERKIVPHRETKLRAEIGKKLQKLFRQELQKHKHEKINSILTEFRDLKRVANVRSNGRRQRIASMYNKSGELVDDQQDILPVFADFYAELFTAKHTKGSGMHKSDARCENIPKVTTEELKVQLKVMRKGKASDRQDLVIEMFQEASDTLLELVASLFSDVLQSKSSPEAWRQSFISVLYKKGDVRIAKNYRPICLLPIL